MPVRLQVIEKDAKFSCGSCGACCDQPWRTAIEAGKVDALDQHDFSKYPQLAGKRFYHPPTDGRPGFFDLAKGEGTKCIFLDTDRLCIIHKELGAEAKPAMCRQFPLLSSRTWVDERVSLNYACPAVQRGEGDLLTDQTDDIARVVPTSGRPAQPDARITLTGRITLSLAENDALLDAISTRFDASRAADVWARFAESLSLIGDVAAWKLRTPSNETDPLLIASLRDGSPLPDSAPSAPVEPFDRPASAPLAARMLFATTLQPDTVPADLAGRIGLLGKLTLIPKLMSLANFSGTYASRVLARNVTIQHVMSHPVAPNLDAESMALICRYVRSRLWQRTLVGTRLTLLAGIHQHIHDVNALLFYARAEAAAENAGVLTLAHIRRGLACVEFHLANQSRVYDQVLKSWLRGKLDDRATASCSLRLMRPNPELVTDR